MISFRNILVNSWRKEIAPCGALLFMVERRYYIYEHRVKEEFEINGKVYPVGVVVYVGSGATKRFRSTSGRSQKHLSIWHKLDRIIVLDGLTDEERKYKEEEFILKYFNSGYLFNKKTKYDRVHEITLDRLNELFSVSPRSKSGLCWNMNKGNVKKDSDAGSLNSRGYWKIIVEGKVISCHRAVWSLHNNLLIPDGMVINHKNLDPSDNSVENLECVDVSTNNKRRGLFKRNSSGVKGLRWIQRHLHWRVSVYFNNTEKSKVFWIKPLMLLGFSFNEAREIKKEEAVSYLQEQQKLHNY